MTDHGSFNKPFLSLASVDALVILPGTTPEEMERIKKGILALAEVDSESLERDQEERKS